MNHPGEELVVLLEGTMLFTVGGEEYELVEGDSLHFRTTLPHSWANPSDSPARAIWLAIRSS
jgi:quercetin dioxygenase-like cupin family protein